MPSNSQPQQQLQPTRFEPVINPLILGMGILGLIVLGGAALLLFL